MMSTPLDPPRFSEDDISLEKSRIALIDQLLAEKGAMKIDNLFKLVQKSNSKLFATLPNLKGFIQSRTNIFQVDQALMTEIRNRSIEYREAMLYIVEKLAKSSKQRNLNFISAELGAHFPTVKKFEIGSGDAAAFKFVSEHKSILAFEGPTPVIPDQRPVGLHPLAWSIPSVWIKEILPEYITSIGRYDRSITISAIGYVVHSIKSSNYLKLEITDGCPYKGQTVYVLGKNVGCYDIDLTERFPRQSLIRFTAFRAYFVAQPWTASSIKDIPEKKGFNMNEQHSTLALPQSSTTVDDISRSEVVINIRSDSAAEAQVEDAVTLILTENEEQNLVKLIDSIVGRQRMLVCSLWTHLQKKQINCLLLKEKATLEQFLKDRPHLYFVDQGSATLRSSLHRSVVSQIIEDLKNGVKYTGSSLGARFGERAPEFKLDVYGSGNQWIHKFVHDHQTLLEIVGPYDPNKPLAQSVQLRHTLITMEKPIQATSVSMVPSAASSVTNSDSIPLIRGCGVVKKLNKSFGYLMIEGGEHDGETVFISAALLQRDCGTINNVGIGTYLNFDATPGKNGMAHPWRATRLSLAVGKAVSSLTASSEERSLASSEVSRELYSPAAIELSESAIEMTSKKEPPPSRQRPAYEILIDREMNRKAKIDNYLEVFGELHIGTLFEKLALSQSDTFSDHYELVEYLCIRSHLYAVHPVSRSVTRQPTDYRRAVTLLLSRCSSSNDLLAEDLWQFAHLSNDGTFNPIVNRCASKLEFEDFLKEHEQLIEMTEVIDDNKNRFVHARGTYDVDSHVFLPRYYL